MVTWNMEYFGTKWSCDELCFSRKILGNHKCIGFNGKKSFVNVENLVCWQSFYTRFSIIAGKIIKVNAEKHCLLEHPIVVGLSQYL